MGNVPRYCYLYNWSAVMHAASSSFANPSRIWYNYGLFCGKLTYDGAYMYRCYGLGKCVGLLVRCVKDW